jgi:cell division septum initiation protein DivIVA
MQADPGGEIGGTMDWEEIERLRVEGFTLARRGYDRHEVDKFLGALLDWLETDAAKDLGGAAVKRKLELAGKSTAQILLTTENESEQMRRQTEKECAELRSEAEAAALEARRAGDEYAKKVRQKADQDARQTGEAASAQAKRMAEEGERRRAQIEALIGELDARRDGALRDLERLHGELASTIEKHKSSARSDRRNGGQDGEPAKAAKTAKTVPRP